MRCVKARSMGQPYQRLMKAFINQEPHAVVSRALSWKDRLPRGFFPRQGRLGRPRRGNARMYNGAMAIFSLSRADGGSLFLDEIANVPLNLQAKLRRIALKNLVHGCV